MNKKIKKGVAGFAAALAATGCWAGNWTDRYNVEWDSPSTNVADNMPLGAGDMACNVWVEKGELLFYIQRSGSFSEIGEHIKLGRVRLTLEPNPFRDYQHFSQKLVLQDGNIAISAEGKDGNQVDITMWVDQFTHSVHVTVDSEKKIDYTVAYESWRYKDKDLTPTKDDIEKQSHNIHVKPNPLFGSFSFIGAPFEVIKLKDDFRLKDNRILFYHRNPSDPLSPRKAIEQQKLEKYKDRIVNYNKNRTMGGMLFADNAVAAGQGAGTYFKTDFKSWRLKSKAPAKQHHIYVVTHVAQEEAYENWESALLERCQKAEATQGDFDKNAAWWNAFWQRSWIVVEPEKKDEASKHWQVGRNYNLFRYMLGGNIHGEFPTKFNGGNLTFDPANGFDPDWRMWGGDFMTGQNQRLMYWPLLKSGDFDAFESQFSMYNKALNGAKIRAAAYFGHGGAVFCENTDASGLQLPFLYEWQTDNEKSRYRRIDVPFGKKEQYLTGDKNHDKDLCEIGLSQHPAMTYHHTAQLEFSYMMLEYYRYSGDAIERYYDFIKQSLVFFDEHYQMRKRMRDGTPLDENGKLVIYPSQAVEAYHPVANPMDVVSGLHACLNRLTEEDLPFVPESDKRYYRELLQRIPDVPFGEYEGRRVALPAETYPSSSRFAQLESPHFYALFPFDLYAINDPEMDAFLNTWKYFPHIDKEGYVCWKQNTIFLARMGKIADAHNHVCKKFGDNEAGNRFPTYWDAKFDSIPDHDWGGSAMSGLQEMLMQCFDDKIHILPCWDKTVDVDFKLHAPKQTTVEVSLRNGKIEKLVVTPESRKKDVVLF
ncbi:DUF5703 domain-containing protein [Pontiella sulfatireligans]|uniref:DUF5703 domain-containing protein n=1 Tax=Pontiella sulfatireligans TaxID=2750658 RepID=A0A6C2UFX7_9BACT|nr:DUF5703 domain-containing protein [Pontiella sulfatireligans]VGO18819.1 hypothetical protein SCARR_00872 [Pontiella sulfatireligans]